MTLTMPVTLSAPSLYTIEVFYETVHDPAWDADIAATPGSDYRAGGGRVVFEPGETSKTLGIEILSDTVAEGDELLVVSLSHSGPFTRMGGFWGLGFGGITDDDTPDTSRISRRRRSRSGPAGPNASARSPR